MTCSSCSSTASCAASAGHPAARVSTRTKVGSALIERNVGVEGVVEILCANVDPLGDQSQLGRRQECIMVNCTTCGGRIAAHTGIGTGKAREEARAPRIARNQ